MITYIVDYNFYGDREHLAKQADIRGNCFCPNAFGMWSFRLLPPTNKFQFLIQDGLWLAVGDKVEMLWGHKAFGHIVVKSIINENI